MIQNIRTTSGFENFGNAVVQWLYGELAGLMVCYVTVRLGMLGREIGLKMA